MSLCSIKMVHYEFCAIMASCLTLLTGEVVAFRERPPKDLPGTCSSERSETLTQQEQTVGTV